MHINDKKIKLSDLIDIKLLQQFQDVFSSLMNIASLIVDDDGPVTETSNFTEFCDCTRKKELGGKRCQNCDVLWGKIAAEKREPVIYNCHTGLKDFAVPIIVNGKHIASIYGGQILTEEPDEEKFRQVARDLDIDEDEYIEKLKKIKIVSPEYLEKGTQLLFFFANIISNIAEKNLELSKKEKKESLYSFVVEKIRGTLDIEKTKQSIVEIIGKTFNADRCFVMDYSTQKGNFSTVSDEYLASEEVPSYKGTNANKDVPHFIEYLKAGNTLIIRNKKIFIEGSDNIDFSLENEAIERLKVSSAYGFPFFLNGELIGVLGVHFITENYLTDDEIDLIKMMANQMAIAIHQAKIYEQTQINTKREAIIGKVISKAISTFDMNEIKQIVEDIGIITKADRCYFVEAKPQELSGKKLDYDGEYLSSDEIPSVVGYEFPTEEVQKFVEMYLQTKDLIIFDYEELNKNEEEGYRGINKYSKLFNLKSGIGIPFVSKGDLKAVLAIEYVKEKVLPTEDELNFLRILGNQIGMTFNQIQDYHNIKKTAERESLLRNIYETMRSSLDINVIKQTMVNEIGMALNADLCFILKYNKEDDHFSVDEYSEYKSSSDVIGRIGYDTTDIKVKWIIDSFRNNLESNFSNSEDFIIEHGLQDNPIADFIRECKIKSGYHFPIYYANNLFGYLIINYTKIYKNLSVDELDMLRTIATKAGIALHQAKLYDNAILQGKRAKITNDIIDILRSTLDKSTIKKLFVRQLGIYFKADRVFFSEYDKETNIYLPVAQDDEYLSNDEEKSFVNYNWADESVREYIGPLYEKKEIKLISIDEYIKEESKSEGFLSRFKEAGVKSSYNMPVLYQQRIMGYFCIEFTNRVCKLSEDDINLIRSICRQAGIALYHSELYEAAKTSIKLKEDFMDKVFNDLKPPLNSIMGLSSTLTEAQARCNIQCDREYEYLDNINNNVNQLLVILNSIQQ